MTRAAFNTTCDIIYGPGTATPGDVKATVDCRLVVEDGITLEGVGAPTRGHYLTHNGSPNVPAWSSPAFGMDPQLADQVAIPAGDPPNWWVLWEEVIAWDGQTTYYRSHLIALPLPDLGGPHLVIGGADEDHTTLLAVGVAYRVEVASGDEAWFRVPLSAIVPYSITIHGLDGDASLETFGGEPGSLVSQLGPLFNGFFVNSSTAELGQYRYIQIVGDSVDPIVVDFVVGALEPVEESGGAACATSTPVQFGEPFVVSLGIAEEQWFSLELATFIGCEGEAESDALTSFEVYGGDCAGLVAEAAFSGTGGFSLGPGHIGPNLLIRMIGDPATATLNTFIVNL